jgi:hypothetical protein
MKPSERIRELARTYAHDNPENKLFSIDFILAIMDYLDEEAAKEQAEKIKATEDLIA